MNAPKTVAIDILAVGGIESEEPPASPYERGRRDGVGGTFHPPSRSSARDRAPRREPTEEYLRGYWEAFEAERFRRGDYDLI